MRSLVPVLSVLAEIFGLWYVACVPLNAPWTRDQAERAGEVVSFSRVVGLSFDQDRPVLPAPHQVAAEVWKTVFATKPTSKKSLVYHAWITISATLLGFGIGSAAGVLLAIGIVNNKAMDMSVMPWAIASQTIPILAIAPMIIVVLNSVGINGLVPKAVISAYLSFFPVVVGLVKGLRSPDQMQMDLLRTYNASAGAVLGKLRVPASLPYLFASLKVGIAASLVGAIVGELPTGAVAGLGARLLTGSYYGQTVQIWAALFVAAAVAAGLVMAVGVIERALLRRMGMRR